MDNGSSNITRRHTKAGKNIIFTAAIASSRSTIALNIRVAQRQIRNKSNEIR